MGRKKKYQTKDELKFAKATQWKNWYERNKNTLNAHRMKRYYELRANLSTDNREG